MSSWRLLRLETYNAYKNMAIDEAVLTARIQGLVLNTVRLMEGKFREAPQSHKGNVVLQHGMILVDVDLEKMFTFLRVVKNKLTSIKNEVGKAFSVEEVIEVLPEGFGKAFNIKLENSELTSYERSLAEKLYKGKYVTDKWNLHGINKLESQASQKVLASELLRPSTSDV